MDSQPTTQMIVRVTILPMVKSTLMKDIDISQDNIKLIITAPANCGAIQGGGQITVGEVGNIRTIQWDDVEKVAKGELKEVPVGVYKFQSLRDFMNDLRKTKESLDKK